MAISPFNTFTIVVTPSRNQMSDVHDAAVEGVLLPSNWRPFHTDAGYKLWY